MDSPSESTNYENTLVSPSTDINENNLDCVVIPEFCSQKRELYTGEPSEEVGDYVSELSLEKTVPAGSNYSRPSTNKRFSSKKRKEKEKATVSAAVSHSQLRRQPPDLFCNCELKTAPGTKNAFDLMRLQKNARITDHNNDTPDVPVRLSNAIIKKKAVNGEACATKVKTGDSMTAL
ncbi:12467_t:CDS:2 [Dentiscutata erythropus]|uniref:12467_t:CDS:1 n=1 Tax=Dentiscutata erythropus TaxID=1348616 RepID=A0A9N9JZQ9_9GLOM|nr:12467_t:CDS:2 [Dentiscutata erythropus]